MGQGFHASLRWVLRQVAVVMLAAAGSALALPAAWADPPGRVGRLAETHGTVWVYAPDQQEWVQAEVNRPLTSGDRVAVDRGARAEVTIGSTTLRLSGDTELSFTQLDDARMQLQLQQGALAARLRDPEAAAQFEIDTPEGRFTPLQPGHYRVDIGDDETLALAWVGLLRFDASDSSLTVTAGRRAELWREDGATHYSWAEVPDDDFADWVLAADRRDELAAERQRYVPPEMTGWEDLDRAGRWESSAEYGTLWIPIQVAPDWAPYRDGHWVWMAPWGWTWVDDAPWGFAPFHYGRWVWWGNRWCWSPGSYVARPVYAPALVGWVGSAPLMGTPSPVVGWVPLAPGEIYYPGYPIGRGHWRALNPHAPLNAYRPRPPSRATANFINRRAPGGVVLMPASGWRQPRAGGIVAVAGPGSGVHGHPASPAPSAALTQVAPPPKPSAAGAVPAPHAGDPRRGLPFVRPPTRTASPAVALPGAGHPSVVPPSPLAPHHARPALPPGQLLSTRDADDAGRRSPPSAATGVARDESPRDAHPPAAGPLPRARSLVISTDDRPAPPAPPGFVRHPHPPAASGDAHEAHRSPPTAIAPPPRPAAPPALVSPLTVQSMRAAPPPPPPTAHGVAPHPSAPSAHETAPAPARPGAGRDDHVPGPQQHGPQP